MKRTVGTSLLLEGLLWIGSFMVVRLCKVSFIMGSWHAMFSGISVLMPLSGAFNTFLGTGFLFLSQIMFHGTKGGSPLFMLAFCVPGLCAALYWHLDSPLYRRVLPLLCMVLFMVHPVGFYAAPYTLFWIVPITVSFFNSSSFFMHALSSTFIAHAVGSVIWVYTVSLTPQAWLSLMPLVCVERLFFALAITIAYKVVMEIKSRIRVSYPLLRNA